MTKNSPTSQALQLYKSLGYVGDRTEFWNPFCNLRQDFLGCVDLIVFGNRGRGAICIQATSSTNHSSRIAKCTDNKHLADVYNILHSGSRFHIVSYGKKRRITSLYLDNGLVRCREIDIPDDDLVEEK